MIYRLVITLTVIVLIAATAAQAQSDGARSTEVKSKPASARNSTENTGTSENKFVPVTVYDPKRDAEADVKEAIAEAARTGKRVLVEVGGEWCIWCHRLDDFFTANPQLIKTRDANFVLVKVNFSEENENKTLLDTYPKIVGYPHIFVLGSDGALLKSQDTGDLEDGNKSYSLDKLAAFFKGWSPVKE